jgi:Nucleotidyl transferase AbiEii toxin, Type IV TA system
MTARSYSSPEAFKQALEQRFRAETKSGAGLSRKRQLLVFDRFLARIVDTFGDAVTLKGGLALELRLARARTTKDIDLRLMGTASDLLPRLQQAGRLDLHDFMLFEVQPDREHPELTNLKYGGLRFRTECKLAGRIYGQPFGVDIVVGEPIAGEPDVVTADDVLGFAGIAPPELRLYPIETHIAEKLHAYTLPRARPNTRVKDLPDLALLASHGSLQSQALRTALDQTFTFRDTHPLPSSFPEPLAAWALPYAAMAKEDELPWPTLADVSRAAREFLEPVLRSEARPTWDPAGWSWGAS